VNLNVDYDYALVFIGVNLVALVSELELFSFFILMSLRVYQGEPKPQGMKQPHACILDSFNKISKVLTNELMDALPPCKEVDHKMEVVLKITPPPKALHRLN